jgi:hypothetical protein
MRSLGLFLLLVLLAACAAVQPAAKGGAQASDARVASPSPSPVGAKGGSPSPIPGVADPSATCLRPLPGTAMVLVGQAMYDVTDPVHPRLVCLVRNTSPQLFTADTFEYIRRSGADGTEVVLHSIVSGNERVVAGWPLKLMNLPMGGYGVWTPDGNNAATFVAGTDANGNQTIQVWLFAQPNKIMLYDFPQPLTDCICRFGLTPPTLAFSADGQYLVSGWPIGKGAMPIRIYRVAEASLVETLDVNADIAPIWSRTGHRLLISMSRSWTPEDGLVGQAGAGEWGYMAGLSPDGTQIAYTGFADAVSIRVYVYDIATGKTRMLIDQSRSEVTFVKDGWVWYLEEAPCANCAGQSGPTDKVFAMNLANGVETRVVFAAGESPTALQSSWGPGQFWPNS